MLSSLSPGAIATSSLPICSPGGPLHGLLSSFTQCTTAEDPRNKKLPIKGGRKEKRQQLTKAIQHMYRPVTYTSLQGNKTVDCSAAATVELVMSNVLNFEIALFENSPPGSDPALGAAYNPIKRTIEMWPSGNVDSYTLGRQALHELSHAERQIMNDVLGGNPYSVAPYSNSQEKIAFKKALAQGINRSKSFVINPRERKSEIVAWLRTICNDYREIYSTHLALGWHELIPYSGQTFSQGTLHLHGVVLNVYGPVTIIASPTHGEAPLIQAQDPVDALLTRLYMVPPLVEYMYPGHEYDAEIIPNLRQHLPQPVLEYFFREMTDLHRNDSVRFYLLRPYSIYPWETFASKEEDNSPPAILVDPRSWILYNDRQLSDYCHTILNTQEWAEKDYNKIEYFAVNLARERPSLRSEANALLRRLAALEARNSDGLQPCRTEQPERHTPFKEASSFSIDDYLFCIDSLLVKNDFKEATQVYQKAIQAFPGNSLLGQRQANILQRAPLK